MYEGHNFSKAMLVIILVIGVLSLNSNYVETPKEEVNLGGFAVYNSCVPISYCAEHTIRTVDSCVAWEDDTCLNYASASQRICSEWVTEQDC